MRKKIILLLCCFLAIVCVFGIWVSTSPSLYDFIWLHKTLESDFEIAYSFTIALRVNHQAVYDLVDPSQRIRVDEWMANHTPRACTEIPYTGLSGAGSDGKYHIMIDCVSHKQRYLIDIDDILIKDKKVVDWGEVKEELSP